MNAIPHKSILVMVLIGIVLSFIGLGELKTNADYRVYFNSNDPLFESDKLFSKQYERLDSLLLILSAKENSLLTPSVVNFYSELERQLASIEHVKRINGFFQFIEDENIFEAEANKNIISNDEKLLQRLRENPRSVNMITADGQLGLLEVGVSLPGINTADEVKRFMASVESVINKELLGSQVPIDVHYSGVLALNEAYVDVVRHDLKRFIPCLFFITLICLFVFFRDWCISLLMIGVALLSAVSAFGVIGWIGWELAAINAFTPIIIMSLNIATSMHLVVNYIRFVAEGLSRIDAMEKSIGYNLKVLTLSKLTTALGFLLLSFSPSPPIQVVGYTVAIGMFISYVLCLTFFRTALPQRQLSREKAKSIVARFSLLTIGRWTHRYKSKIILFSVIATIIGLLAVSQLQINDNAHEYFSENHRFTQGTQLIDKHFDGSIRLLYSLDSGSHKGLLNTEFIEITKEFTSWLANEEIVKRVDDIYSMMSKKGINLNSIQSVLDTNSPSMLGIEQEVADDYRSVKVSVVLKTVTAKELIAFDRKVRDWLDINLKAYGYVGGVGHDLLFAKLGEKNARSMFFSLGLALAIIALITAGILQSWSAIYIGMVCNLLPVIIVFAIWSIVGGYISLGSAMVMGMILGIIVDDTLHMLLKYPRSSNVSTTNLVRSLYEKVCPAILITSITLVAGLFVGLFSGFRPIYELSLLSISIIFVAMLTDLFLLPALMYQINYRRV